VTSTTQQRTIFLAAVRELVVGARTQRALLPQAAPDRDFYLGVEAAATEMLHPEMGPARPPKWLERETPMFREGYLATANELAVGASLDPPPVKFRLAEPRRPTAEI
jgi:hypothetical protein